MDVRVEGWIKSEWRNSMEAASDLLLFRIPPPLASQGSIFKIALFHNGLKADYMLEIVLGRWDIWPFKS